MKRFYKTLSAASAAARKLGVTSQKQYESNYKLDVQLPRKPYKIYSDEWVGWRSFLGTSRNSDKGFYPKLCEAAIAVKKLAITSKNEYRKLYKRNNRLPSNPPQYYSIDWKSWGSFFGRELYPALAEASSAARKLGITSSKQYVHTLQM